MAFVTASCHSICTRSQEKRIWSFSIANGWSSDLNGKIMNNFSTYHQIWPM